MELKIGILYGLQTKKNVCANEGKTWHFCSGVGIIFFIDLLIDLLLLLKNIKAVQLKNCNL